MMQQIIILRHAEKPEDDHDCGLSPKGKMRAAALAYWLPTTIDYVFATAPSKRSKRPIKTIKPIAKKLDIKISHEYADEDYEKLAHELRHKKFDNKTILVCWHHGQIPHLAKALGICLPFKDWPETIFDIAIVISNGNYQILSQKLLYGDSASHDQICKE